MQWFRFYTEAVQDIKLRHAARQINQPLAFVVGVWAIVLAIASDSPERGRLMISADVPATDEDIAHIAGCNVTETLLQLLRIGIVTKDERGVYAISSWDKRQYESDDSAERVKRHRERQKRAKGAKSNGDETLQSRSSNAPDTDTDTDLTTTSNDVVGSPQPSPVMAEQDSQTTPTPTPDPAPAAPPKRTVANPTAQQLMIGAVADVCLIDLKLKSAAGRAGKAAAELLGAGYTAAQVTAFKDWWYACDWRGQRGDTPTPARVVELIKQSLTPRPDIVRSNNNVRPERSSKYGANPNHPQNGNAAVGGVVSIDEYTATDLSSGWR